MKSFIGFFSKLTVGKKLLLLLPPVLSIIVSMKAAILGLWLIILIDLLTGIRKDMYVNNVPFNIFKKRFWFSIKSYLLRKTWKKIYEYNLGILVVIVFEALVFGVTPVSIIGKTFTMSELAVLIPSMVEVWSIFENFEAVSGKNVLKRLKFLLPESVLKILKTKADE